MNVKECKGGDLMFRKKFSKSGSRKNFRKGAKFNKRNFSRTVRRGGIRL